MVGPILKEESRSSGCNGRIANLNKKLALIVTQFSMVIVIKSLLYIYHNFKLSCSIVRPDILTIKTFIVIELSMYIPLIRGAKKELTHSNRPDRNL